MDYYDLVLGTIPASFLGVGGGLAVFGIDLSTAAPIAALLAIAVIGHALFVRSPVRRSPKPAEEASRPAPRSQTSYQSAD